MGKTLEASGTPTSPKAPALGFLGCMSQTSGTEAREYPILPRNFGFPSVQHPRQR